MKGKRVLLCMGTRPEIIKMAPVYQMLKETPLEPVVLHTGQHWDLAWPLYDFFQIEPDYSLDLNRSRATLGHLSALLLDKVDAVFDEDTFDAVLVHGDTSSALMAALAAFYHQIPIGHVEAGLRSHSRYNPFPEEQNRALVARLAHWHFSPTHQSIQNLIAEGIAKTHIHHVGNTVVDAAQWGLDNIEPYLLNEGGHDFDFDVAGLGERLLLVTAHRRENWGTPIADIARAVALLVSEYNDVQAVWPLHPNPSVRATVHEVIDALPSVMRDRIHLTEPLNYPQMLAVMQQAWMVLTDSGGIQEEAAALKVPVLVLRTTTERPELIEAGGGLLVGTNTATIQQVVRELYDAPAKHEAMTCIQNPFGDGHAASYIAAILYHDLIHAAPAPMYHAA